MFGSAQICLQTICSVRSAHSELHLFSSDSANQLPAITQLRYSSVNAAFAVDFEKLWDIEKHFFIENIVKMVEKLPEKVSSLVKELQIKYDNKSSKLNESLNVNDLVQNTIMPNKSNDEVKAVINTANSDEMKPQSGFTHLMNKISEGDSNIGNSNELINSAESLQKQESKGDRNYKGTQFMYSCFETAFKTIYPKHPNFPGGYIMPLTLVLMESMPGVPIGVKMYTYSTISANIVGMFLPVDPLFWKSNTISNSMEQSLSSSQASDLPVNLLSYFEAMDWEYINQIFQLETVGDCYQFEMHFDRRRLTSGHQVYLQSLDTIVDFSSVDI